MGKHLPSKKKLWDDLMLLNFMGWCKQNHAQRLLVFLPFQSTFPQVGAAVPLSRVFSDHEAPSCQQLASEPPAQAWVLLTAFCCAALCATRNLAARVWLLVTSYSTLAFRGRFVLWQRARAFLCSSTNLRKSFLK